MATGDNRRDVVCLSGAAEFLDVFLNKGQKLMHWQASVFVHDFNETPFPVLLALGTPLAQYQKADQPAVATQDRHKTFWSQRRVHERFRARWNVQGFSMSCELLEQRHIGRNSVQLFWNEDSSGANWKTGPR